MTTKLQLPPKSGKYKCKYNKDNDDILDVFYGKEYIGSLWSLYGDIGICETVSIHESDTSRVTNKTDLLYFIDCIDFLEKNSEKE